MILTLEEEFRFEELEQRGGALSCLEEIEFQDLLDKRYNQGQYKKYELLTQGEEFRTPSARLD